MKRRTFITLLGGAAAAWPLAAGAQQAERVRRIGILMPLPPTNAEAQERVRAFREELRKRGWAAGVNAQFDERWTGDNMDLIRSAATNLRCLPPSRKANSYPGARLAARPKATAVYSRLLGRVCQTPSRWNCCL
jgi:hypothetical protein